MKNWEKNIRQVIPYTPGEQPNRTNMVKLNTNENPYPPAPEVQEALRKIDVDSLRLYPDPNASSLVRALADSYHLQPEQVFVGVGSDDVLAMCFVTRACTSARTGRVPSITHATQVPLAPSGRPSNSI